MWQAGTNSWSGDGVGDSIVFDTDEEDSLKDLKKYGFDASELSEMSLLSARDKEIEEYAQFTFM